MIIVALGPILISCYGACPEARKANDGEEPRNVDFVFRRAACSKPIRGRRCTHLCCLGDLITLAGTLGFSIYTVLGKRVAGSYDTISMTTFNATAAAILWLPLAIRQGMRLDWKSVGWAGWTGLFYMVAFSAVGGYLAFYWFCGTWTHRAWWW